MNIPAPAPAEISLSHNGVLLREFIVFDEKCLETSLDAAERSKPQDSGESGTISAVWECQTLGRATESLAKRITRLLN